MASVRIALPGGRVFEAGDEVSDVSLGSQGEKLDLVQVDFEPQTAEEAYERALRLAEEWNLNTADLHAWFRERMAQRAAGKEDVTSRALAMRAGQQLAPWGPAISVQIRYSFNDRHPSLVSLKFAWDPD